MENDGGKALYKETYRQAREQFAASSAERMAGLSGAVFDPAAKEIRIVYLNRAYTLSYPEARISSLQDAAKLPIDEQSLILQYLAQASGVPISGRWISFAELPHGMLHHQPFVSEAIEPLARAFGVQPEKLLMTARSLGGEELGVGDAGVRIPVFPRIPMAVILWVADEEFPARANIIFDASAPGYLSTAALYVLGIAVSKHLQKLAA